MKGFSGFPKGKTRVTPVPNLFFSELLPYIDNIDELKLTLYCFWSLTLKEGDLILMAAFGSGFTWGASLIKW